MNKKCITIILFMIASILLLTGCYLENDKMYSEKDFTDPEQYKLAEAIVNKDISKVEELAPKTDLEGLSEQGMSLLMLATSEIIQDGFKNKNSEPLYEIVTILMKSGADADQKQGPPGKENIISPLMYTWEIHVSSKLLKAMLDGGLDPNYIIINPYGEFPLIRKHIGKESVEKFKLLVEYGADIYTVTNFKSNNPRHLICSASGTSADIAMYLLDQGVDPYYEGLAYMIFDRIVFHEMWIEGHGEYNKKQSKLMRNELIKFLKVKQILIQEGVPWPPEVPENEKNRRDWKEIHEKNIDKEKQISEKYDYELN